MAFPFPHQPEIRLQAAPVAEVICQVRFPSILAIMVEEPSAFQDKIRHHFPALTIQHPVQIQVAVPGASEVPAQPMLSRNYQFSTTEDDARVNLTADFFALTVTRYAGWQAFKRTLDRVQSAVEAVYAPSYATRIGLRYTNRLTPSSTRQQTMRDVLGLVRPSLTGLLQEHLGERIDGYVSQLILSTDDSKLALRTASGRDSGSEFFLLDFDHYTEGKVDFAQINARIDSFHQIIYNAFRWCLQEGALEHFDPSAEPS